jgi:hypothetical protein
MRSSSSNFSGLQKYSYSFGNTESATEAPSSLSRRYSMNKEAANTVGRVFTSHVSENKRRWRYRNIFFSDIFRKDPATNHRRSLLVPIVCPLSLFSIFCGVTTVHHALEAVHQQLPFTKYERRAEGENPLRYCGRSEGAGVSDWPE